MTEFDRDLLGNALNEGVVEIIFTKVSGETRVMKGTTNQSNIPSQFHPKGDSVIKTAETKPVFDIENQGWRSFRWDNLQDWKKI
jgi:hypothetical protein